ncbi:rhomboid family intramembrane serine protease [Metabacillus iocasae]|uniref:Membrane associated rhomboid family serine protease n=1 Tax=Priestia iocasae TaxID=2291674 RepID=A0ABS2R0Q0_9BACI|nr:rhomboid family intramembrane serine protease [Metabacillus iocasae]MBM7705018.1 membrane associated rhomboid family serine protease [Metabacillus iocasae]
MFVRTETFREFIRFYPITSILIAIHLLFWIILILPLSYSNLFISQLVGVNGLIEQGEYWRLVTPIFLHSGFSHLLFNTFSLVLFAPALERLLGKSKFIFAYIGSGLIANIITFWLHPPTYSHVGSSGAIFGLLGMYIFLILYQKHVLSSSDTQIVIVLLVIGLLMGLFNARVNMVAHVGGMLGGFTLSFIFFKAPIHSHRPKTKQFYFWLILSLLVIIGLFSYR